MSGYSEGQHAERTEGQHFERTVPPVISPIPDTTGPASAESVPPQLTERERQEIDDAAWAAAYRSLAEHETPPDA